MAALSIVRYDILRKTKELQTKSNKRVFQKATIVCVLLSLFWALGPLLGWSNYSLEGNLLSCSIEHLSKEINVLSFNLMLFSFALALPICIILIANIKALLMVRLFYLKITSN